MSIDVKIEFINIEELLKPIELTNPVGQYLKYETEYDQILNALKSDNPKLEQGIWKRPLKKEEWKKAKEICIKTLNNKSKDLQIAAWLIQVLLRGDGFKGLYEGLKLILELTKKYWDLIYPLPEYDDLELRLTPFIWLDEKLSIHLKLTALNLSNGDKEAYNYYKWEQDTIKKRSNKNDSDFDPESEYLKDIFPEQISFHENIDHFIKLSKNVINDLKVFLNSNTSNMSPSFHEIIITLDQISLLNNMAIKSINMYQNQNEIERDSIDTIESPLNKSIQNIDDAFFQINQAINFLIDHDKTKKIGETLKSVLSIRNDSLKEAIVSHTSDVVVQKEIFTLLKLNSEI